MEDAAREVRLGDRRLGVCGFVEAREHIARGVRGFGRDAGTAKGPFHAPPFPSEGGPRLGDALHQRGMGLPADVARAGAVTARQTH